MYISVYVIRWMFWLCTYISRIFITKCLGILNRYWKRIIPQIQAIVRSRQRRKKFDRSLLEDISETVVLESQANKVTPLVTNPGTVLLTTSTLYFQPHNNAEKVIYCLFIFYAIILGLCIVLHTALWMRSYVFSCESLYYMKTVL